MSLRQNLTAVTTAFCLFSSLVAQAGGLPAHPPAGVDPDLGHVLETAKENLQANKPAVAARDVLNLYLASDHFTQAQRPVFNAEGQAILHDAGKQLLTSGQVEPGINALDGAWLAGGRAPDPEYGKILVDASANTARYNRPEALYLARRARLADPNNAAAEKADKHLSANRYKAPALAMLIIGGVALAAGVLMYANAPVTVDNMGNTSNSVVKPIGLVSAIAGGAVLIGGSLLLRFGKPIAEPVSPAYLPAFMDATN